MPVFLLSPNDSVSEVAERTGGHGTISFIPTNEPPTAKLEQEFLSDYLSTRKNGYFEVRLDRPPAIERAAEQTEASPPVIAIAARPCAHH